MTHPSDTPITKREQCVLPLLSIGTLQFIERGRENTYTLNVLCVVEEIEKKSIPTIHWHAYIELIDWVFD